MENNFIKLKEAVDQGDNEAVHGIYDQIMKDRLIELDPELVKRLDAMTQDASFWYA